MNPVDITKTLVEYEFIGDYLGIDIDPIGMYSCFHEQHKRKYGSLKPEFRSKSYTKKVMDRDDWILCNINCVVEELIKYRGYFDES